ncbi:NlpC/P60 family protein [Corallococcus exiguus]|uniref:NlpC/P60 family protein n=1 Tax=Corallococcus exiguus TaxID=83462 RepID=UPI003DA4C184
MHSPYRWGAKGQRVPADGPRLFDCSGLVTWALNQVGGPDWRPRTTRTASGTSARPWRRRRSCCQATSCCTGARATRRFRGAR